MIPNPRLRSRSILRPFAAAGVCLCVWLLCLSPGHAATSEATRAFDIPAGPAEESLKLFSTQAGRGVIFSTDSMKGARTNAVRGELTSRDAILRMTAGTALTVTQDEKTGAFAVRRDSDPNVERAAQTSSDRPVTSEANSASLAAATPRVGSGMIEGRVLNSATGNYLNNARVGVDGTTLEVFTNEIGEYRLTNVTAGNVTVRASYTGLAPQAATVSVASGGRAAQDFSLTRGEADTVLLDAFVIAAAKDMSGREIAINEQRYAANFKNVVSADEFGDIAEGNIGEFLKFIPGITIDQVGPDARNISVRGLPPEATVVMADGMAMASAASATASRVFELEQVSINNVSRIEVTKSPTPDVPGNAVGGSVNMISRSAFERSKPLFTYRAYLNWNTDQGFMERTKEGPSRESTNHTNPSFDFSYIKPVNKNFGFTFTGSYSDAYNTDYRAQPFWVPSVTGSALSTADNPFLRNYTTFYGPKVTRRMSVGTTTDWRISHGNVLTLGVQWNSYDAFFNNKTANVNTLGSITNQAPTAWDSTFTQSRPGAGSVDRGGSLLRKYGNTTHLTLKYAHDGETWKIDAGATYSNSVNHQRNGEEGFVNSYSLLLPNLTLRLGEIDGNIGVPKTVTAASATGAPVTWDRIAPYRVNQIVINEQDGRDVVTNARVGARRNFNLPLITVPVHVRTGLDVRRMNRDISDHNRTRYNFVGPDRSSAATSTDDFAGLYDLADSDFYAEGQSGFGEPWLEYASPHKLYDLFAAHPEYWVEDVPFKIQNEAIDSKKLVETVSAAYLRTDWRFFKNRLQVVGGVRYERTEDEGWGVKNDPTALYQRDAGGNLVRGANGLPVRIPGLTAIDVARLQYTERGSHSEKSYGNLFPSANAVFNLTNNLLLRAAYAKTINRPSLSQIIPGMTVTDPNTANVNNLLITITNTDLKPWTAENVDLALEYYFGRSGSNVISVGGFRKDIKDFFASRRVDATPEFLDAIGLDDSYLTYDVSYRFNSGDATVSGVELNYRQALTFLPHWARGVSVFYNMNQQRLEGTTLADFSNFVRRSDNYGFTVSRPKFTLRVKVNDLGRQRRNLITGTNMAPATYRWRAPRRAVDIDFEYRIFRGLSVFVAGRNVFDAPSRNEEVYGIGTPEYARPSSYWLHGINYVMGFKGSF